MGAAGPDMPSWQPDEDAQQPTGEFAAPVPGVVQRAFDEASFDEPAFEEPVFDEPALEEPV